MCKANTYLTAQFAIYSSFMYICSALLLIGWLDSSYAVARSIIDAQTPIKLKSNQVNRIEAAAGKA